MVGDISRSLALSFILGGSNLPVVQYLPCGSTANF